MTMTNYLSEKLRDAIALLATHPGEIHVRLAAVRDTGKLITVHAGLFPDAPQYDGTILQDDYKRIDAALARAESLTTAEAVDTADRLLELLARVQTLVRAELAAIGQV